MKSIRAFWLIAILSLLPGCGTEDPASVSAVTVSPEVIVPEDDLAREETTKAIAHSRSMNDQRPKTKIRLPKIDGWSRSSPRPLAPEDRGFTVVYEHHTGITVILYQYRREYEKIPDSLEDPIVIEEMDRARKWNQEAVQIGYWQSAKESDHGTVTLGESDRETLWSRCTLAVENSALTSDTFVWTHRNTFFKLRCTTSSVHSELEQEILGKLLTAIGKACQ